MVQLEITEEDAAMLVKLLDYYISELRMEIADTDREEMRDKLKGKEKALKSISKALADRL